MYVLNHLFFVCLFPLSKPTIAKDCTSPLCHVISVHCTSVFIFVYCTKGSTSASGSGFKAALELEVLTTYIILERTDSTSCSTHYLTRAVPKVTFISPCLPVLPLCVLGPEPSLKNHRRIGIGVVEEMSVSWGFVVISTPHHCGEARVLSFLVYI